MNEQRTICEATHKNPNTQDVDMKWKYEEIIEQFIRWSSPLAEMAGTQWADDEDLSQECHWLNETIKEAKELLGCPAH